MASQQQTIADQQAVIAAQEASLVAEQGTVAAQQATISAQAATIAAFSTEVLSGVGTIAGALSGTVTLTLTPKPPTRPATKLAVLIGGTNPMPNVAISIDDKTGKASFAWLDDTGEVTPDIPVSADGGAVVVTLACSNPAIATLAADPAVPQTFDITALSSGGAVESAPGSGVWAPDGTVSIVASCLDDTGAPVNFADGQPVSGSTPFGVHPGLAGALAITTTA